VLVDASLRWTVRPEEVRSLAGWSPFTGRTLTGRAVATFLRGELVMERGTVVAQPGRGRFVARSARTAGIY
jgi:dihydroorotase-like cyclic amidohydrolase